MEASQPLYSKGKSASQPQKRRLSGLQSRSVSYRVEQSVFPCRKSKLWPSSSQPDALPAPENLVRDGKLLPTSLTFKVTTARFAEVLENP
jgi:hypothetical protein